MTVISTIVTALRGSGYEVSLSPQEKIKLKTCIVTIDSYNMEVETAGSYFVRPVIALNILDNDVERILTKIPAIMNAAESAIISTVRDFKFTDVSVNMTEGIEYLIQIKFTYTEVISIT